MLLIPGNCWLCQQPLYLAHHGICSVCLQALPRLPHLCTRCGLPLISASMPCYHCLDKPPPWQRIISVSNYVPPVSLLIQDLKFRKITALSLPLARLLLLTILKKRSEANFIQPDKLMTVPLHHTRAWWRGYNQSELLARPLARWLNLCYLADGLKRKRAAIPQHYLSASERRDNLHNAYQLTISVKNLHIVLLDDIVTTGTTVGTITQLLKQQGAASVQIWCLCRAL